MTDIMTPALGESVTEATVARWTKKPGEAVKRDEVLVELDTDKVSLEVVAPEDGVLAGIDAQGGGALTPPQRLGRGGARSAGGPPPHTPAPRTHTPPNTPPPHHPHRH